jgi:hypothetical protein
VRWFVLLLCCWGCGRIGFDVADDDLLGLDAGPRDPGSGSGGGSGASMTIDAGGGLTRDAYFRNWQNDDNFGSAPELRLEGQDGQTSVVAIAFDLTMIPASASVASAELHLWTSNGADMSVAAYEILEAWDEGNTDHATGAGNWDSRRAGVAWTAAGIGPGSRGTMVLFTIEPSATGQEYVSVLPAALVQRWVTTASQNHGIALVTDSREEARFHSSESSTTGRRPSLRVSYTH